MILNLVSNAFSVPLVPLTNIDHIYQLCSLLSIPLSKTISVKYLKWEKRDLLCFLFVHLFVLHFNSLAVEWMMSHIHWSDEEWTVNLGNFSSAKSGIFSGPCDCILMTETRKPRYIITSEHRLSRTVPLITRSCVCLFIYLFDQGNVYM